MSDPTPTDATPAPIPAAATPDPVLEIGEERGEGRSKEYWNGDMWVDLQAALQEGIVWPEDIATEVHTQHLGGGAIGSLDEYATSWRIWRYEDTWILDMREDGLGLECHESLEDCVQAWKDHWDFNYNAPS